MEQLQYVWNLLANNPVVSLIVTVITGFITNELHRQWVNRNAAQRAKRLKDINDAAGRIFNYPSGIAHTQTRALIYMLSGYGSLLIATIIVSVDVNIISLIISLLLVFQCFAGVRNYHRILDVLHAAHLMEIRAERDPARLAEGINPTPIENLPSGQNLRG